jgi:hypothetical protein
MILPPGLLADDRYKRLSSLARHCLLTVALRTDGEGICEPSQARVLADMGLRRVETLNRLTNEIEAAGLLRVLKNRGNHRPNQYRVLYGETAMRSSRNAVKPESGFSAKPQCGLVVKKQVLRDIRKEPSGETGKPSVSVDNPQEHYANGF